MKNNPKKTAIIKTAIRCISQYGIEGSSADVIARKMEIAHSGIFYYFPKQEDLFDSLVEYIAGINHGIVSEYVQRRKSTTPRERLVDHLLGNLNWGESHPDQVAVLLLSMAKTGRSRTMRTRINRLLQVGEDRIHALLTEIDSSLDRSLLAAFLHQSLTGIIISQYYSRTRRKPEFFEKVLLGQIDTLLDSPSQP